MLNPQDFTGDTMWISFVEILRNEQKKEIEFKVIFVRNVIVFTGEVSCLRG